MLKQLLYILIFLLVVYILINSAWRIYRRKKREAVSRLKANDHRYLALESEKEQLKSKRNLMGSDHPYQRIIALRINEADALNSGDTAAAVRIRAEIDGITAQNGVTDEEELGRVYTAQVEAMNTRLTQIDFEQRKLIIEAEKVSLF